VVLIAKNASPANKPSTSGIYRSSLYQFYTGLFGASDITASNKMEYLGTGQSTDCKTIQTAQGTVYVSYIKTTNKTYSIYTSTTVGQQYDVYTPATTEIVQNSTYYIGNTTYNLCTDKILNPAIRNLVIVFVISSVLQFIVHVSINGLMKERKNQNEGQ
jgi:hypothetical protein